MPARRRKVVVQGVIRGAGIVNDIGLRQRSPVDEYLLVDQLQTISRQADDALHEMLVIGIGVLENNDVAAFQLPVRQHFFVPGPGSAENKLVHQQVVADQQRAFHRCRRNLKGLYDETCAEERQNHRHQQ